MNKLLPVAALLLLPIACKNKSEQQNARTADSTQTAVELHFAPDSTIYGTSDEFGMSTFTLVTRTDGRQKPDTLYLSRTAGDGTDAEIYGSLNEGQRYALTTRDNREALATLVNIDELEMRTKDYRLYNGRIILGGDTLSIVSLSPQALVVKGKDGKEQTF